MILERDSQRWFKPARGQFQIYYKSGADDPEYQPDFVAEADKVIYLLESKAESEMDDPKVVAKRDAAANWCSHASTHAKTYDGKPWKYVLIPHDIVLENMTLEALAARFAVS